MTHPFSAGGFLCFCHVCNLQTIIERMKRIPAELLQAAMGRTVAPPGVCQSRSDAREPAGHRSRCGPSVALPGPSCGRQSWADAREPAGHRSRCGPSVALLGLKFLCGNFSHIRGGTRYYAVALKTFLTGGRGKEYAGTHAQTGTHARSGAGVASSQETHAKTPAIYGRFCKCLRQPMSGANATALSHIRAWGPSAGFPTGVFPPGGLPRTRTRHRTGARLSALSWTRFDWESQPLFAFFRAGVSHVCPWGKNLA